MRRREFVTALGAAAALSSGPRARAAAEPAAPANRFAALAEQATRSAAAGKECLRLCLEKLAAKDASFGPCARAASDLVAAAPALAALAATNAPFAAAFAKTVADISAACKKECERFSSIPECKTCAEACAALAEECLRIAG